MIETLTKTVQNAYNKFFFKKKTDEHILKNENNMLNAIENRRIHMIERGKYITQHKILTSFETLKSITDNINQ